MKKNKTNSKDLDGLQAYPVVYSGDYVIDFIVLAPHNVEEKLEDIINIADGRWTEMSDNEQLETGYGNRFDYIFNEVVEAGYYIVDKGSNIYY